MIFDADFRRAEEEVRRAVELAPGSVDALAPLTQILIISGR
jgi:hypothetical protein